MFENITKFFKNIGKKEDKKQSQENSKDAAKERLHLVLMQDRANVSADFLELMKQEIIDVIKKYIEVDEKEIDVRLTNKENEDGTNGAPALYANIPILNIKNDSRKIGKKEIETKKENEEKTKPKETKSEEKTEKIEKVDNAEKVEEIKGNEEIIVENKEEKEENKDNKTQEKVQSIIEEIIERVEDKEQDKQEEKEEIKSEK